MWPRSLNKNSIKFMNTTKHSRKIMKIDEQNDSNDMRSGFETLKTIFNRGALVDMTSP